MDYQRIDSDFSPPWSLFDESRSRLPLSWRIWSLLQRGIALLGGVLLLPLFAILYVVVRCTSRGPFLFSQLRRGYQDKPFRIYKIRTMVTDPRRTPTLWVSRSDPHVTWVGRVLRDLKLDELPQLWNVVLGQMQFVGPRPIAMDLDDFLRGHLRDFAARNSVLPGLTSLAQLTTRECRSEADLLEHWRWRLQRDLECIRTRSIHADGRVLLKTALYLLSRVGSILSRTGRAPAPPEPLGASATLILGTPVANMNDAQVLTRIEQWIAQRSSCYVAVCPVYSLVHALWDPTHRRALREATLHTPDGVPVVWAQRWLGCRWATRVAGPTLMVKLLERANERAWRVAFYGGEATRLQQLVASVRRQCPNLQIVAAISPPFRPLTEDEDEQVVSRLNHSRPDVILVGLGCPKQERWMLEHTRRIAGVMLGVGAAFDFHSGALPRAPMLLQRLGLEWAFRLYCEPRRLFWRYATTNPVYLVLLMWQILARLLLGRQYQVPLTCSPKWSRVQEAASEEAPGIQPTTEKPA